MSASPGLSHDPSQGRPRDPAHDPSQGFPVEDLAHHGDAEVGAGLADFAVNVRAGTPPSWLAEIVRDSLTGLAAYPDGARARAAVARRHGRPSGEVLLTSGAAEAFVLLARVLRPRRAVVVHPQFTEPEAALRAAGHNVDRVVLDGAFTFDPASVPADADLVVIGNPTNPTSVLHPSRAIRALLRPGRTVVVDEAFMDCVPGEPESLAADPGVVVLRSLTKTWGLAGLRAGYVLAPAELITALESAQPLWAVSTPALAAIEACMSDRAYAEAEAWAAELTAQREHLTRELGALGLHVVPEARASFLCVRARVGVRDALRERGYAVRRGDTFPGLGPEWIRIAVRDPAATRGLVAALAEVLSDSSENVTIMG
ncbi:Rv2231c family pyridoxal phosphate-dependent protein CobC [Actinocorallia sp. A-T 12471]|uniref:Rv2231c family pyridoxal phosphate-dependent protein CobC n=1 Tax=Actinocorallia sp. A-T 12471 TaxID=3089813 RepID=UPI0029CF153B|nr:Rv2231c family pyridoxal phosphate-dependent protein CobC [Actinocorallia sp. A-T 12471]MDX6742882.1 Rv2231c family pyridoxal phosphate-dependent protein CobC [Actinocorallia sp. A-T 12471]